MPRVKYDGLEAVDICLPEGRETVKPGGTIDVPAEIADELIARDDWSAVAKPNPVKPSTDGKEA